MGANEKHDATYHGGEYTPSERYPGTARVRERYLRYPDSDTRTVRGLLFDRWLDDIRAEAKAEAWDECMSSAYIDGVNRRVVNTPNPYKENQS